MAYVEFLRVRKAFLIFAGIVVLLVTAVFVSLYASHGGSGDDSFRIEFGRALVLQKGADGKVHQVDLSGAMHGAGVPLGALLGIAGYCAAIFATVVSTSLNKERDGLDFTFTRPESRERTALSYLAVDLAGVLAAFVMAFIVMGLVPLALVGLLGRIAVEPQAWWVGLLGLAISLMWFGLIQAITAGYRGGGGWVAGTSWAFFGLLLILPGATFFGPIVHAVVMTLNLVNPLAYFTSLTGTSTHAVKVGSILQLGMEARTGIAAAIGLVACTYAVFTWKRLEV